MPDDIHTDTYAGPDRRRDDRLGGRLKNMVAQSISEALADVKLVDAATHERHHAYINSVLQREADRAALRKAVIEKTLAGLVWAGIVWIGAYVANHWRS
jgi:hypothetical protein